MLQTPKDRKKKKRVKKNHLENNKRKFPRTDWETHQVPGKMIKIHPYHKTSPWKF